MAAPSGETGAAVVKAQSSLGDEYRAKASFLPTVPNFVEWLEEAFQPAWLLCSLCLGRISLRYGGRPNRQVRWVHKDSEARSGQMLFLSRSEEAVRRIFGVLRGSEILTVGETQDFLTAGGVVHSKVQDQSAIGSELVGGE
jgi:hypothetical protein